MRYTDRYSRHWVVDGALGVAFVGCWSSGFIGAKLGAADAPVTTVLIWRFVPLVVVLVPVALLLSRRAPRMPRAALGRQVAVASPGPSGSVSCSARAGSPW